jgi:hypothetical protein
VVAPAIRHASSNLPKVAGLKLRIDKLGEAQVPGEGGRQEEPHIGDEAVGVGGHVEPIEAVRRSHRSGVLPAVFGYVDTDMLHAFYGDAEDATAATSVGGSHPLDRRTAN